MLTTGLRRATAGSILRLLAKVLRRLVRLALVGQSVADELSDDVDVLRGAVVEGRLVNGLERRLLAVIEANTKLDLGDRARAEVADVARCGRGSAG